MSVFSDVLIFILNGYLAMTGAAAQLVSDTFDLTPPMAINHTNVEQLESLPSDYEYGGDIPDVLIKNALYQRAAVFGVLPEDTYTNPDPEKAIVNIFCEYRTKKYVRSTTGSGYMISPNGVVLTNAHVAQFLLLEDASIGAETNCVVRTGSVASTTYEAELLYISPAWIIENAKLIDAVNPRGTGERDYALLYITRRTDNQPLKSSLPALYPNLTSLSPAMYGDPITIGGYPSNTIAPGDLTRTTHQAIGSSSIHFLYTFGENQADLISLTGSPIGVSGMSGGPVINEAGEAVGLIVTRGNDSTQGDGSLNALTLSYINRTIEEETTLSLFDTLRGDLPRKAKIFKDTMKPLLAKLLNNEL